MSESYIKKIHLENFKGFRSLTIDGLNKGLNVLVGDNDTGKSTILLAIDLTLAANISRVESIGLDRLLCRSAVEDFLQKEGRSFADLPIMEVDLYLNDFGSYEFEGEHNLAQENHCGISLHCKPRHDLKETIDELISNDSPAFPYEYYSIEIKSFSGSLISPYKKPVQHIEIDNTKISNDYASRSYIQALYRASVGEKEKNKLKYGYRQVKENFTQNEFTTINKEIEGDFGFSLKSSAKTSLETDLTISRDGIDIENMGVGAQCFIRTKFALSKKANIDIVLLEEPENHLSHINMKRLIEEIRATREPQVFIATHSSLICSRLDLRNVIIFGSFSDVPLRLADLPSDTAEFFIKAPNNSVLQFVLSNRNLLVEGDAEFILMESLYQRVVGEKMAASGLSVISVGGVSFPRYLDIAKLLGTKTAVVTDNDGDFEKNCVEKYEDYKDSANIQVFSDTDINRRTFEICIYQDNSELCERIFASGRRSLSVQDYMLKNKSSAAFELYKSFNDDFNVPNYIRDAVVWLKN